MTDQKHIATNTDNEEATPQLEPAEVTDTDLDSVAGGQGNGGSYTRVSSGGNTYSTAKNSAI